MGSEPRIFAKTVFALLATTIVFMFSGELALNEDRKVIFQSMLGEKVLGCSPLDLEGNSSKAVSCLFQKHASALTLFVGENEVLKIRNTLRYHKNVPSLCDNDVDLLIMTVSNVGAYENRNTTRNTWKNSKEFEKEMSRVKVAFLIPTKSDEDAKKTSEEAELYKDIIQIQFYEGPRTGILLEAIALTWFKKYCYNAKYYLKTNDRFMLNPKAIKNVLTDIDGTAKLPSSMLGRLADRTPVIRSGDRSTCHFFYPFEYYPVYIKDNTYFMHREAVLELDSALDNSHFFPLADVYLSGLTAELANIERINTDKIIADYNDGFWEGAKSLGYIAAHSGHMKDHWRFFSGRNST